MIKFGDTCLHFASKFGHISTVKMLVERFKVILLEDFKGYHLIKKIDCINLFAF